MLREEASRSNPAPFPTTKEGQEAAKAYFRENKGKGKTEYFIKPDGSIHSVDNKGGGKEGFYNYHTRLKNNSAYRARKLGATPSKADYIRNHGEKLGVDLFDAEQEKLRSVYDPQNYNPKIHDVDHQNPLKRGGIHHSNNLIPLDNSINRSKGATPLDKISKAALLLADNIDDQISLQGPLPTTQMRQDIALKSVSRVSKAGKLMSSLDKLGKVGLAAGVVLTIADGLSNGASAAEITNGAGGQIFDFINPIPDGGSLNGNSLQHELAKSEQYTNGNRPKDPFANGVVNGLSSMAGNQLKYIGNSLANGKIPYNGD